MSAGGLVWRKSSHSDSSGGDCVEIAEEWRKSSYSGPDGNECVEVAGAWHRSSHSDSGGGECVEASVLPSLVRVRDSKRSAGPVLGVDPAAWTAFLGTVRRSAVGARAAG